MITQVFDYFGHLILNFVALQTVYSLIVFLIVVSLTLLLRKRSPHLSILLWSLVLLRFVLPPQYATAISLRSVWETGKSFSIPMERALELHQLILPILSSPVFPGISLLSWHVFMVIGWFVCVIVLTVRFYSGRAWFRGLLASAQIVDNNTHIESAERWRKCFGIRRPVRLLTGNANVSPFTYGVRKPQIYLPKTLLSSLPGNAVEVLIAHEMAHISRLDDLWLRVQRLIQQLFFFNPIIWICNRQIENSRELICDKMVVSHGTISAELYGKTMLKVLKLIHTKKVPTGVAGYVSDHSFYRERLLELLAQNPLTAKEKLRNLIITAVMIACVLPLAPTSRQERVHRELAVQLASDVVAGTVLVDYQAPLRSFEIFHPYGLRKNKVPLFAGEEFHSGVDLAAQVGAEVFSVSDGIVEIARAGPMDAISVSTGGYIVIKHEDGNKSVYAHVSPLTVTAGQSVKKGQLIGKICPVFDTTNLNTNAYLHFELISNDIRVNPELHIPLAFD